MRNDDINTWKKTDPDNFQFGRQINEDSFEFKEFDRNVYLNRFRELKQMETNELDNCLEEIWNDADLWVDKKIQLDGYTEEAMENYISSYYVNLDEVKRIYGDDWKWIVAECIFEQTSLLY